MTNVEEDFKARFGLGAFMKDLMKVSEDASDDRHWEVNEKRYDKKKGEVSESDFQDKNRFLAGREMNIPLKEEKKVNRYFNKQAEETEDLAGSLAQLGGMGVGLGTYMGAKAHSSIMEAGQKAKQNIHPDIDKLQAKMAIKERAKNILQNKGSFVGSTAFNKPMQTGLSVMAGGTAGLLALQAHRELSDPEGYLGDDEETLQEQQLPKEAFTEIRDLMVKVANYYDKK